MKKLEARNERGRVARPAPGKLVYLGGNDNPLPDAQQRLARAFDLILRAAEHQESLEAKEKGGSREDGK